LTRVLYAKRFINRGKLISENDITYKRPATGIEPKFKHIILNKRIKRDKNEDDIIKWNDLLEE